MATIEQAAKLYDPTRVDEVRAEFEASRYVALKSLISDGLTAMLYAHVKARSQARNVSSSSVQGLENTEELGLDPLMETVLAGLLPLVEDLSGLDLHPTYSFCRLYRRGDRLTRHRDRDSCEVSLSLNLGQQTNEAWPLWIAGPHGERAANLAPGDALLYRGIECEHWRDELRGTELAQVFLHYVDKAGPYADYKFDGRQALNTASTS